MTAASGMEDTVASGKVSTREDQLHRGRRATSVRLIQGWGQFSNQVLLTVLLIAFHHGNSYWCISVHTR